MKNKLTLLMLVVLAPLMLVLFMGAAPQVSSWTDSTKRLADGYIVTTLTWTADSTGHVSDRATTQLIRGAIFQVITNPDSSLVPAIEDSSGRFPSDNYDITLIDADSLDVMGGSLADRDTENSEKAVPKTVDGTEWAFFANSHINVKVTNNIIPNARGKIKIYWWEK